MPFFLAQEPAPITPGEAVGIAERMSKGGVPVICLVVAIAAIVALLMVVRSRLAKEAELAELERTYRLDLEARHKAALAEAEKRLADTKAEAKERAVEVDRLMRERMAVDRESAETLAHTVQMVQACGKTLERVERSLDRLGG